MERIDLAIIVLAVVAVGGSVAGLLTYQGGGLKTYTMEFEAHTLELDDQEDQITGSGATEFTFSVDQANLTEVAVEVTVSSGGDPVLVARDVNLTVEGPNGSTGYDDASIATSVQGGSATLSTTVPVSEVPATHEEQATSAEAVRRQAIEDHGHTMEAGDWTVEVTIDGDADDPATFDVAASLVPSYFDVHISQRTPDVQR